jgi:hypothetical protein
MFFISQMSFLVELHTIQDKAIDERYNAYKEQLKAALRKSPFESSFIIKCYENCEFTNVIINKFIEEGLTVTVSQGNYVIRLPNRQFVNKADKPAEDNKPIDAAGIVPMEMLSWGHPDVIACMQYFIQVFMDDKLIHYMLKYFASFLVVGNNEHLCMLFIGDGSSSITTLLRLIKCAFEENEVVYLSDTFEGRNRAFNAKVCIIGEEFVPQEDCQILQSILYSKEIHVGYGRYICPQFKLIGVSNHHIYAKNYDDSLKQCIKIIPFLSTFTDNAPNDTKEQLITKKFPQDRNFDVTKFKEAFKWILKEYLPVYKKEGLIEPQIVKDYSLK